MSADLLALLEQDPAAGILATADLREKRAKAATQGATLTRYVHGGGRLANYSEGRDRTLVADFYDDADREYIAAEADPAHALAAVRRWRGVVERHKPSRFNSDGDPYWYSGCTLCLGYPHWPCPDLTETADEARAYLGGTA
jgi:hypothetical protein